MPYKEKSLQCRDCGKTFPFTVEEQEFYASKGYTNEPKRCPECRAKKRAVNPTRTEGTKGQRQMYPAICAQCGKETRVPFQPRGDRPVYCQDCFNKKKAQN